MASNASASLPESVVIGNFTVHKLMLGEYTVIFEKMQKIPQMVAELDMMDEGSIEDIDAQSIIKSLPKIIAKALPEAMEIIALATHEEVETVKTKMDLKTAVQCFKAIFELNDFLGVWEVIAPMLPEGKTNQKGKQTGSKP